MHGRGVQFKILGGMTGQVGSPASHPRKGIEAIF